MAHDPSDRLDAELQSLETLLHSEIPITRAMGVRVAGWRENTLELSAPLDANINHKDTAFGGSINSLMTLAGWGVLSLLLRRRGLAAKVVIQSSSTEYHSPIVGDFTARCRAPEAEALERLVRTLQRRGRARIGLRAEVVQGEILAASFEGRFVVGRVSK